jgi:putative glutamine amidotransferase
MSRRYFDAAVCSGAVPWMVPLLDDDVATLREIYDRLDGVLLPGGVDVDPAQFGEARRPGCGVIDPARDRVELQLVRWAAAEGKPVLGLCRGLQVLNVALGGSLYQDLGTEKPDGLKHDCFPNEGYARDHVAHDVAVSDGSHLRAAFRRAVVGVNSMHHQGILRLASPLVASAVAPDGLVEAVEAAEGGYLVGVQWHPEVFDGRDPGTRRLFEGFIAAARMAG